jgi:hypothetical protein
MTEVTTRRAPSQITLPSQSARPDHIGQQTAIEQARAIAEVQAAVIVAQQNPRSEDRALDAALRACDHPALADRAFWSYPREGQQIVGPTIHLARELARCWGNIQYGVHELRRDDAGGYSEMQAWAWDLETNARPSTTFVSPHARDTRRGRQQLTDVRDIYENNANVGARRLREQIFAVLPVGFVEDAKARCMATLERGNGTPIAERAREAVQGFANRLHVTQAQLEQRIGRPVAEWTEQDLAQLRVVYTTIDRGESTVAQEFGETEAAPPAGRVTGADIAAQAEARRAAAEQPAAAAPEPPAEPPIQTSADTPSIREQIKALHAVMGEFTTGEGNSKQADRQIRLDALSQCIGRHITSSNDLTRDEASVAIQVFRDLHERGERDAVIEFAREWRAEQERAIAAEAVDTEPPADVEPEALFDGAETA